MSVIALLYSDRSIDEVREIGGPRYNYVEYGHRTLITSNWFYIVDSAEKHLEQLAEKLGEGMAVHRVHKEKLRPYGINRHGQFFIAHKKGHDHYIFELSTETRAFSIDWSTDESGVNLYKLLYISKLVLVGEGNALRKVRRWVKHQLTKGQSTFSIKDLAVIRERASYHQLDVLLVTDRGFVMNLKNNHLSSNSGYLNSKEQIAIQGWTQLIVNSGCKSAANRNPVEAMLNQVSMLSNR